MQFFEGALQFDDIVMVSFDFEKRLYGPLSLSENLWRRAEVEQREHRSDQNAYDESACSRKTALERFFALIIGSFISRWKRSTASSSSPDD